MIVGAGQTVVLPTVKGRFTQQCNLVFYAYADLCSLLAATFPFIKGLFRTKFSTQPRLIDGLHHLEQAKCCEGFKNVKSDCVEKDWSSSFDK